MKYYFHSAIPYVNAAPHIGHAQEFVMSDVVKRYQKLLGNDVTYLCGADENGLKIIQAAEKMGINPESFCDQFSQKFVEVAHSLNVQFDIWQRGTNKKTHVPSSQYLWSLCEKNGDIYKKSYSGLYCIGCEAFYTPDELINGIECPEHPGKKLETVSEENYFFRLSKYESFIRELIQKNTLKVLPEIRKNEALSFINRGLIDFSISRSKKRARSWGVPVPNDPDQFMYVWFDALNIYQSGIGFGWDNDTYNSLWPPKLMIIGKGILRFHAIYWMAILKSAGLQLPTELFVHGYLTVNGQKMSKTIGNVIDPLDVIKKFGVDPLRYYLLKEIPSYGDGDYSERRFKELYNADLSNGIGNLLSRIAKLCEKSEYEFPTEKKLSFDHEVQTHLQNYRFDLALEHIWKRIKNTDKILDESEPWKKSGEELKKILILLISEIRSIGYNLQPFLPDTASKIISVTNVPNIVSVKPLFLRLP
jgi:methionyl-tRNA synthetase